MLKQTHSRIPSQDVDINTLSYYTATILLTVNHLNLNIERQYKVS